MKAFYQPGNYLGRITTWGLGKSKNKGTPEFQIRFEVLGKINPNDPEGQLLPCTQYERTIYRYITTGTKDFVIEDLEYLGYDKPSFRYLDPNVDGSHDFSNREIKVRCDHEEYQGEVKERWALDRGHTLKEVEPLDSKAVRELDALFGSSLKKAAAPATRAGVVAKDSNDPIPF